MRCPVKARQLDDILATGGKLTLGGISEGTKANRKVTRQAVQKTDAIGAGLKATGFFATRKHPADILAGRRNG